MLQNVLYSCILYFLNHTIISSTLLPLLVNTTNSSRRKVLKTETSVLLYSGATFLPGVHCTCPPIPLPESPHDDHWPPVLYRYRWLKFRVGRNKRPVKHPLGLGSLLPNSKRFPTPNYLYVGCVVSSPTQ